MRELIITAFALVIELAVFFCAGTLLMRLLKMKENALLALALGYIGYFCVFELVCLPLIFAWCSLTVLSVIWAVLCAGTVLAALFILKGSLGKRLGSLPGILREHSWLLFLALAVAALQCLIVVLYQDTTVDAAYYVGTVSTSVYTDTLGRYNPYTGYILKNFPVRYILSAYPMNNAVWCRLLGVHPMTQSKLVMSVVNVLTANILVYHIGLRLFKGEKKQADLMVCFVCLLQLFSYTIYTPGTFFFTRSYEGKALLANISVPFVFYCSIWLWQETKSRAVWAVLFLAALSAVTFSGSAIIFPAAISAGILPVLVMKKKASGLLPYLVSMVPSALYFGLYFSVNMGWLVLRAS